MVGIAFLIIGLALGGGAVYLWTREKLGRASEKLSAFEQSREDHEAWEDRLKAATGDVLSKSQTSLLELTEAKLAPIKIGRAHV